MKKRKICLVLGNGFTIDFLRHIEKAREIDVVNLFRDGPSVPWPATGKPGFLSFKHCPHLWNLGARPNMDSSDAMSLIEDIITCVNVYASRGVKVKFGSDYKPNDIYILAYKELAHYLKHLFIYYNQQINDIPECIKGWGWYKYIEGLYKSDEYDEITIVTYNYDVWLERVLEFGGVPYTMGKIGAQDKNKITILKPHGSISFVHQTKMDKSQFSIRYIDDLADGDASEFTVSLNDLDDNYLVNALIPPAGESARLNQSWASDIRNEVKERTGKLTSDDELIICGISYWHVDRAELDEIIVNCSPDINVMMINPNPLRALNAVLTSVFSNYVVHTSGNILREHMK